MAYNGSEFMHFKNKLAHPNTMLKGNSCESKFKLLLSLPSLEEIYIAGAKSHIPQVHKVVDLGWLEGTVKRKRLKLVYLRA